MLTFDSGVGALNKMLIRLAGSLISQYLIVKMHRKRGTLFEQGTHESTSWGILSPVLVLTDTLSVVMHHFVTIAVADLRCSLSSMHWGRALDLAISSCLIESVMELLAVGAEFLFKRDPMRRRNLLSPARYGLPGWTESLNVAHLLVLLFVSCSVLRDDRWGMFRVAVFVNLSIAVSSLVNVAASIASNRESNKIVESGE